MRLREKKWSSKCSDIFPSSSVLGDWVKGNHEINDVSKTYFEYMCGGFKEEGII